MKSSAVLVSKSAFATLLLVTVVTLLFCQGMLLLHWMKPTHEGRQLVPFLTGTIAFILGKWTGLGLSKVFSKYGGGGPRVDANAASAA